MLVRKRAKPRRVRPRMPTQVYLQKILLNSAEYVETCEQKLTRSATGPSGVSSSEAGAKYNTLEYGYYVIDRMRTQSQSMAVPPSGIQVVWFDKMLMSNLAICFGSSWRSHKTEILARYSLQPHEHFKACIASWPRRFGKTHVTSMFGAILALNVSSKIVVLAPRKDQSIMLLNSIESFIRELTVDDSDFYFAVNSKEKKVLRYHSRPEFVSYISAVATSNGAKAVRGKTADLVIVDEGAHMDDAAFQNGIGPLMTTVTCTLVIISTPMGTDNPFDRLMNCKWEDGSPAIDSFYIRGVCDPCKDKGVTEVCGHTQFIKPSWIDEQPHPMVLAMSTVKSMQREALGTNSSDNSCVFASDLLNYVFSERNILTTTSLDPSEVHIIFVSIDPGAGSALSDTAILSATWVRGFKNFVILAAESVPTNSSDYTTEKESRRIVQHIAALGDMYINAVFVIIAEANLTTVYVNGYSSFLDRNFDSSLFEFMRENGRGDTPNERGLGILKSNKSTQIGVTNAIKLMKCGNMRIANPFIGTDKVLALFKRQLAAYERTANIGPDGKVRSYSYSGKTGDGACDDLVASLVNIVYFSAKYLIDDNYKWGYVSSPRYDVDEVDTLLALESAIGEPEHIVRVFNELV